MKHKTAFLVHGFNVRDGGRNTTDRLRPYFESKNYHVVDADYGWMGLFRVRLCNRNIARSLAQATHLAQGQVVGVGHSNGCALLYLASRYGAKFDQLVFINPALDRGARVGARVKTVHVWHSPSEIPTKVARWMPWNVWGDMGAVGYKGKDPRYINYNKEDANLWTLPDGRPAVSKSHSDVFMEPLLGYFAPRVLWEVEKWFEKES